MVQGLALWQVYNGEEDPSRPKKLWDLEVSPRPVQRWSEFASLSANTVTETTPVHVSTDRKDVRNRGAD